MTITEDGLVPLRLTASDVRVIADVFNGHREATPGERDLLGADLARWAFNAERELAERAAAAQWITAADAAELLGCTVDTLYLSGIVNGDGRVHRVDLEQYVRSESAT